MVKLLAAIVVVGCASEPDVKFEMETFRAPPEGATWVAWTKDGFVAEGQLVAAAGVGCLPTEGWPDLIVHIPGEPDAYWLYGSRPEMSGEALGYESDTVTFDCVVTLDGRTRSGAETFGPLADDPRSTDHFGTGSSTWRQRDREPVVKVISPNGVVEWRLSDERQTCWLTRTDTGTFSTCLPTVDAPGIESKRWVSTPNGLTVGETATLEFPTVAPEDASVWLFENGGLIAAVSPADAGPSKVWASRSFGPEWGTRAVEVPGTVTSAVFRGDEMWLLSIDFREGTHRLFKVSERVLIPVDLPQGAQPNRLHLASDGTLWATGYGSGWRLAPPDR